MSCECSSIKKKKIIYNFGNLPRVNEFLKKKNKINEKFFPLGIVVCKDCLLVQNNYFIKPTELFEDYKFISKASKGTITHFEDLVKKLHKKKLLTSESSVLEIGSNDGTLLSLLNNKSKNIVGVDLALKKLSKNKRIKKIKYIENFFDEKTYKEVRCISKEYDLIIALNVIPHINDFTSTLRLVAKLMHNDSVFVIEGVYFTDTINRGQFDTVYHEHAHCFSYFAWKNSLNKVNLKIIDIEKINVQGTSLRLYVTKINTSQIENKTNINKIKKYEINKGINKINSYENLKILIQKKINLINQKFTTFSKDSSVIALGAPARGVVILNVCKIFNNINFAIDDTPFKKGLFLPGTNIKVINWSQLKNFETNKFILLSWNYKKEILDKLIKHKKSAKVFIPFPTPKVINLN